MRLPSIMFGTCLLAALLALAISVKAKGQKSWNTYSVSINPVEATHLSAKKPEDWQKIMDLKAVEAADFSPDGQHVAFVTGAGRTESEPYKAEHSDDLEVWDYRTNRLVAKTLIRKGVVFSQSEANATFNYSENLRYTPDGQFILTTDATTIHVFSTQDYRAVREIDFGPLPSDDKWSPTNLAVSPDSTKIAVEYGSRSYRGGLLRIYDLASGKLIRERRFSELGIDMDMLGGFGLAWSSDGRKLAVTWSPVVPGGPLPSHVHNLLVLDAATEETLLGINTGYVAGPVAFGANNTVVTASLNPDVKLLKADTIKIWDADTGKLLREIASPPAGVHDQLETSADGRIVLGYVGLFKYSRFLHDNETVYQKFRLWSLATGELIATSPEILPLEFYRHEPRLRLSRRGDSVLILPTASPTPPIIYELR